MQNTFIHFKISVPRIYSCSAAYLVIDKDKKEDIRFDMFWCGMNGADYEWWECDFAPWDVSLYFYHFEIQTNQGMKKYYKGSRGNSTDQGSTCWQLTSYSKDYSTPKWLSGGIMYQIFPDRFHNSGTAKKDVPKHRRIHETWNEPAQWQPNEVGVIDNCDFFCGDLKGIEEKLAYISSLGVTCIYCNPVFEAYSNHRYDTGNYSKIDPMLGTEQDFKSLCKEAAKYGIKVIIDGVFSHTGSDSIYFNKYSRYDTVGAFNSKDSPYYSWYNFSNWPYSYDSWWGFDTLPNVNELDPSYNEYINGKNGIIRKWLKNGASGWRLDVADELPDGFLDNLHSAVRAEDKDALVLGEVWEDATNKIAYGQRRRYLLGGQLDTVMNYPFRNAIIGFLKGAPTDNFFEIIEDIIENYPKDSVNILMNHVGTHDTERIITVLAGEPMNGNDRKWQSEHSLTKDQMERGIKLVKLAALMQFTLPGVPCIYYGDEVGLEGYKDPFNRQTYPWGHENEELLEWYRELGAFRKNAPVLKEGDFASIYASDYAIGYKRFVEDSDMESLYIIINRSDKIQLIQKDIMPINSKCVFGIDIRNSRYELGAFECSVYSKLEKDILKPVDTKPDSAFDTTAHSVL